MKEIKIVRECNPERFEAALNDLLAKGYRMQGSFNIDRDNYLYAMMFKY